MNQTETSKQRAQKALIAQDFLDGLVYHGKDADGNGVYGCAVIEHGGNVVHLTFRVYEDAGVTSLYGARYHQWIADQVAGRTQK